MKKGIILFWGFVIIVVIIFRKCHSIESTEKEFIVNNQPDYNTIAISVQNDTIKIPVDSTTSPQTLILNHYKRINGKNYLIFTNDLNSTVIIVDFNDKSIIKKIHFKRSGNNRIGKGEMSGYLKNFDSLYIFSSYKFFLSDTCGNIQYTTDLWSYYYSNKNQSITAITYFHPPMPPVFEKNYLYIGAYPDLASNNLQDLKKWPVIYKIDMQKNSYSLLYHLPKLYTKKLYGQLLVTSYYCYNQHNKFVFSFPADKNIYETSLNDSVTSYYGKSKFLAKEIESASKNEISNGEDASKFYFLHDCYGPIFYDPYKKRYLRIAEKGITKEQLKTKQWYKEHSLIIFDEHFKIIGESLINKYVNLKTLFFTPDGIFARLEGLKNEENKLCFVKLEYNK